MENQTVIKVSIFFKVFSFLFFTGLWFLLYTLLGGPNTWNTLYDIDPGGRLFVLFVFFSACAVFSFVCLFFDFRKITIDKNGILSVEVGKTKQAFWEDIVDISFFRWGVKITTKSETFSISRWGMDKNKIWNAIDFYRNGPGTRRTVNSGGRIF